MATVLPPPSKKQRTATAEKAKQQQSIATIPETGQIRVQFFDQANGQSFREPFYIPIADATVKNLELLLNTLQNNVGGHWITGCAHLCYDSPQY